MSEKSEEKSVNAPLLGGVFAAICGVLVLGWLAVRLLNYDVLYADLSLDDAALVTAELDRREVRYHVENGGADIAVPANQLNNVRLALYNADGPTRGLSGFELFNESEMGLTDFAQRIKFQRAIQGELSRTIMMLEGVRRARVHIALPERTVFRSQYVPPKAAVTLNMESDKSVSEDTVAGIQRLVASAVPKLSVRDVSIMDGHGKIISRRPVALTPGYHSEDFSSTQSVVYEGESSVKMAVMDYPHLAPHKVVGGADELLAIAVVEKEASVNVIPTDLPVATEEVLSAKTLSEVGQNHEVLPVKKGPAEASFEGNLEPALTESEVILPVADKGMGGMIMPVPLILLMLAILLALGFGGVFLWRRGPQLSRDETKSFAQELSQRLSSLENAEV